MGLLAKTEEAALPGVLTAAELGRLGDLERDAEVKEKGGYRQPQFLLFLAALDCVKASQREQWDGLVGRAAEGINFATQVNSVTPYLFYTSDRVQRIIAAPHRSHLRDILSRLSATREPPAELPRAVRTIRRCAIAATIAAEKGAIHIARENLGAILVRMAELPSLTSELAWTAEARTALQRSRYAAYRAP